MTRKPKSLPVFNCDKCGACCEHLILEAQHVDALREPRIIAEGKLFDGHGKIDLADAVWNLNSSGERMGCVFLGADKTCGIYSTRPEMCVSVQAGGRQCQMARGMANLPPLIATAGEPTIENRIRQLAIELDGDDE